MASSEDSNGYVRIVQKRLRNVEKKLARLADIETRLAQGLEPKQTQQEIEQALANKAMNTKLRDEYAFIIEEIQKLSLQLPPEMSDSGVHAAVSASAAAAANATASAAAAALEVESLRTEMELLRASAAASAAAAAAANEARAEMESKIASASALIAHEAAPPPPPAHLPPPSDSSAAATSLPSPQPLPLPAVVPGLSLSDLQTLLPLLKVANLTVTGFLFQALPGPNDSVTALLHGITLDVPVRDDCDLCCLYLFVQLAVYERSAPIASGPQSSAFDLLRAFVEGSDSSVAQRLQLPEHTLPPSLPSPLWPTLTFNTLKRWTMSLSDALTYVMQSVSSCGGNDLVSVASAAAADIRANMASAAKQEAAAAAAAAALVVQAASSSPAAAASQGGGGKKPKGRGGRVARGGSEAQS